MKSAAEKRNGGVLPSNRVIMSVKEKKDPSVATKPKSDYMKEKEREQKIVDEAGELHDLLVGDRIDPNDLPF
jgi:hypothetical protein